MDDSSPRPDSLVLVENTLGILVHDLNGPIGVGVTGATFLEEIFKDLVRRLGDKSISRSEMERLLQEGLETANTIHTTLTRAAGVLNQGRTRIQIATAGPPQVQDVAETWQQVIAERDLKNRRPGLRAVLEAAETQTPPIRAGSLYAILSQFVENSMTHGFAKDSEGSIRLRSETDKDDFVLSYHDDGRGMDRRTVESAFKPSFSALPDDPPTKIGLAVVHRLVTRILHGSLHIDSAPGDGVVLTVRIPLFQ